MHKNAPPSLTEHNHLIKCITDSFPDDLLPVSLMPENTNNKNSFLIIINIIEHDGRAKDLLQDQFLPVVNSCSCIKFVVFAKFLHFTVNIIIKAISSLLIKTEFNIIRYIRNIIK